MVNALFTNPAITQTGPSTGGTVLCGKITRDSPCSPPAPLLMARSYPPGAARESDLCPVDLAVVAELVDAQR